MDKILNSTLPIPLASSTPNKEKKKRKKKKRPPHKSKMITGYIIYASEIRKEVIKKYPDRDFGDISKLVGIEWKNLPQETKIAYEKRAQEQNAKSKAVFDAESMIVDTTEFETTLKEETITVEEIVVPEVVEQVKATTQTEPIQWVASKPKKPLRFSKQFLDYLNKTDIVRHHQSPPASLQLTNGTNDLHEDERQHQELSATPLLVNHNNHLQS